MISVVMPSYNSAPFVAEAVESVLNQTYKDFELLVCDDGSSDGTQEIVESYARRDARVRLLRHSFRSVSLNCNAAVEAARFPWIARLDADDVMVQRRLEWQIRAAEREPAVVLWGGYARLVNRTGKIMRTICTGPVSEEEFRRQRRDGRLMVIQGPTVMFRRDLFLELGGYDRRFDSAEDLELLSRMAERGSARVLPRSLTLYRVHGSSITAGRAAHQARLLRYIPLRNKARIAGMPEESLEAFVARLDAAPMAARVLEWMDGRAQQLFKNARIHAAEGRRVRAALDLGLSMALNPIFAVPRTRDVLARVVRLRLRVLRVGSLPSPAEHGEALD